MPKKAIDAALVARAEEVFSRRSAFDAISHLNKAGSGEWYRIGQTNAATREADILIYDAIGWFGISAADFARDLAEVDADVINLHLNSGGGSIFDGIGIYNQLVQHKALVRVHIDGIAASIASVIAMAGDEIKIGEAAHIMVHEPFSLVIGTAQDMRKEADILDDLEGAIIDVYEARTGLGRDELQRMVTDETWLKGQAAVDAGFADEVIALKRKEKEKEDRAAARVATSLPAEFFEAIFPNIPEDVRAALSGNDGEQNQNHLAKDKREFEEFLRQHGYSKSHAFAIASHGFKTKEERREDAEGSASPSSEQPTESERREDAGERAELAELLDAAAAKLRS
jgi:ATP-dependent Clp protease, protease subunit